MNDKSPILLNNTCISRTQKQSSSKKKWFIALAIIIVLSVLLFFTYPIILTSLANNLVYEKTTNKADVIIVLSGGEDNRIITAVDLYKKGISDKILMCGGGPFLGKYYAEYMGEYARRLGVRRRNLLYELNSLSTYENAKYSYPIIKRQEFKSILIVTSKYHTKRSYNAFKKFYKGIDIYIVGSKDDINYKKWWQSYESTEKILNEFVKTLIYFFKS